MLLAPFFSTNEEIRADSYALTVSGSPYGDAFSRYLSECIGQGRDFCAVFAADGADFDEFASCARSDLSCAFYAGFGPLVDFAQKCEAFSFRRAVSEGFGNA